MRRRDLGRAGLQAEGRDGRPEGWVRLVQEAGWTPQEYAAWLGELIGQQLLALGDP